MKFGILVSLFFSMSLSFLAHANDKVEKMAAAHEEAAKCLRSGKDPKSCHEAMHKTCKENMGSGKRPMHEGKGRHHGKCPMSEEGGSCSKAEGASAAEKSEAVEKVEKGDKAEKVEKK